MKNKQELIQAITSKLLSIMHCTDSVGKMFLERDLSYLYAELGMLTYQENVATEHDDNIIKGGSLI